MDRLKHYGCFDGDSSSPWGTNIILLIMITIKNHNNQICDYRIFYNININKEIENIQNIINAGVAQDMDRAQINEICGGNLEGFKPGV